MEFKSVLMSIVAAAVMVGCASQSPVRVNGKLIDKPESVEGIVTTQWQQGTIASWRIAATDRVLVCLDQGCKEPAPEPLRQAIEKLGIRTAKDKQEAAYTLSVRGFVTDRVTGRDGEKFVIPAPAIGLVGAEPTSSRVAPWLGKGGSVDDLQSKGLAAFGLLSRNVVVYNSLWHQTGQLTQTIGGGSPGAYLAGFLLGPILNAVGTAKTWNDLTEGLSGIEMVFLPADGAFKTVRIVYGFAASTREESPEDLIAAALMDAIEDSGSFIEGVKQESAKSRQDKEGV
ncbi:MAG: hypothetical protein N3C59_07860 [Azovibrio sp.]|nr:hypothetical protein [Azovibrio sp.]